MNKHMNTIRIADGSRVHIGHVCGNDLGLFHKAVCSVAPGDKQSEGGSVGGDHG